MAHNLIVLVENTRTVKVIGQFRVLRRYFSGLLCFRDPIAFVLCVFLGVLHGQ
jgi:hypothetical protein